MKQSLDDLERSISAIEDVIGKAVHGVTWDVYAGPTMNASWEITHELGVVPENFFYSSYSSALLYATEGDRALWTDKKIVLKATAASARFTLTLVRRRNL